MITDRILAIHRSIKSTFHHMRGQDRRMLAIGTPRWAHAIIALLAIIALMLWSCKKEDDAPPASPCMNTPTAGITRLFGTVVDVAGAPITGFGFSCTLAPIGSA